ncbi:MAG TPA: hypothetical protein VI357_13445 [Mycobacteriales bacterium]
MSFETGAPPPPPPLPDQVPVHVVHAEDRPADVRLQDGRGVPVARPARGYDSTAAILMGPPPGTRTYVLRATETTETTD